MKINVGIDLGTTYSAVAVFNKEKGETEILKNSLGKNVTPSVIWIENGVVVIGEDAKAEQAAGNTNTAAFYKSLMGEAGYSLFIDGRQYTPEELSGLYLKALKGDIEEANCVEIEGAVITVPAYFGEVQRLATMRAGTAAGFKVLKIINEPTSAIIAYGLTGSTKKTVLVYDLGGGTFDVTIANVNGTEVDVVSTNGNHQLGGKDWDSIILEEAATRFRDEFGIDVHDYPEVYNELLVKCEQVKQKLTSLSSTTITVSCDGFTGKYEITRSFFEQCSAGLLNEKANLIQKCFFELSDKYGREIGWDCIDEVILAGGSTRMPQVRQFITERFCKPPVTQRLDVDTVVAAGAAMQAELCTSKTLVLGASSSRSSQQSSQIVIRSSDIKDITAHSLGMLAISKDDESTYVNSIIIPKNSRMNETFGRNYKLKGDSLDVYVLQGESESPYDCEILYRYVITGMPRGVTNEFTVNFLYNNNGVVEVNAVLSDGTILKAEQFKVTETADELIARLIHEKEDRMKNTGLKIIMMLDTSGSMSGTPVEKAKDAMMDFVRQTDLSRAKIAVVDFADSCRWACHFTNNERELETAIMGMESGGSCGCGTSGRPLKTYGASFTRDATARVIVVLTDGVWSNQAEEEQAADRLKKDGVIIYAIGFGSANEAFLQRIASEKGARKVDLNALGSTFKEIASTIATEV